ncbi:hypothetical protein NW767_014535 [Fusarium falciforme]|nr:hypothetical protein NW767_014535 [Fusarium falciforme]
MAPGIEEVKISVLQWKTDDDTTVIPYQQSSSRERGVGTLSIRGLWFLQNGPSGFFVLWGIPASSVDGDFVTWVETSESFLEDKFLQFWGSLEEALQEYLRRRKYASVAVVLATDVLEAGFRAKVKVKMIEFLGRKTYTVDLDIDGWEDRPVSMVTYLEALPGDWT